MLRFMTTVLVTVFCCVAAIFFLVKYLENTAVFFPGKIIGTTPDHISLAYEDLYLTTSDGVKINAWLVKAGNRRDRSLQPSTIIFAHGNAGTMSERVMKIKFFHEVGLNVLIFDYRGYGKSQGHPSEAGVYQDAQAVYDYLQTRTDIDRNRLIAYGASLGGVVAVDLACKRKVAGLIVESSITSAHDMVRCLYPSLPSWMLTLKFDSVSKIGKITIPKLFLHSRQDEIVPFSIGERLYEAAAAPKNFIEISGGHNDCALITDPQVRQEFIKFLKTYSL